MHMKEFIGVVWAGLALTCMVYAVGFWWKGVTPRGVSFVQRDTTLLKSIASGILGVGFFLVRMWWLS